MSIHYCYFFGKMLSLKCQTIQFIMNLYIIAGCNGAGKTTASYTVLPNVLNCREFINADEIAVGISPFQPETAAIVAGRIMLRRIEYLLNKNSDFALETTLATKTHKNTVLKAQAKGYHVTLLFFWLQTVELAKKRVQKRVSEGGHNIETAVIERRYVAGIINLFEIYLPIVDDILIYDNSEGRHELIAKKINQSELSILNEVKFNLLKQYYDDKRDRK